MTDPKKICFLMPVHYMVSKSGGAENQVKLVMESIEKTNKYDIHFLCRHVPDYIPNNQQIWKIGTGTGFGKFWTFTDAARIYRTLKQIAPQIIYQNVGSAYTGIAALYAKRNNTKFIWHIASDLDVNPALAINIKSRFIRVPDRMFLHYGIRHAHVIAGQTQYQNALLKKKFGRKCDAFIPIGHPFPEVLPKKKEKLSILWIANLKPLKQPEIFVKLAKEIGKSFDVSFVMIGHPDSGKRFNRLTREINATPNLSYLGGVTQNEVNRRLSEGHILINTSKFEGFSNTFIQAWMREVPVVSLNADPDNILVRQGIGFHSKNYEQLFRDVVLLIENRNLRDEMGKKARKYAFENNTIEKMLRCFTNLIA